MFEFMVQAIFCPLFSTVPTSYSDPLPTGLLPGRELVLIGVPVGECRADPEADPAPPSD